MTSRIISIRFPDAVLEAVDEICGQGNRTMWVVEACQIRLSNEAGEIKQEVVPAGDATPDLQQQVNPRWKSKLR